MSIFLVSTAGGQEFEIDWDPEDAVSGISVRWAPVGEWEPVPMQSGTYWTETSAAKAVLEYTDGDDTTDRVVSVQEQPQRCG